MNEVILRDKRFSRVRTVTTRPPRPDDEPGHYFYATEDEISRARQKGLLVSETIFPTTGYTYGTYTDSYASDFCLLDTLANSVDQYRALPFKRTVAITMTAPIKQWTSRFLRRYPVESNEALKRLSENKQSILWSLAQPDSHQWLVNRDHDLVAVAARLVTIIDHPNTSDDGVPHARAILKQIEKGLWQSKS